MPALAPSRQRSPTRDDLLAAARQGAHDRGAAADVGAVADDDAGRDAALDHRGAERAGVEVDEALVHDGGALGEVGAEAHPVGVGDADAGWAGRSRPSAGTCRRRRPGRRGRARRCAARRAGQLEALDGARAGGGPHDVGEQAEDAVQVHAVRLRRAGGRAGAAAARRPRCEAGAASRSAISTRRTSRVRRAGRPRRRRGRSAPPRASPSVAPRTGEGNHASRTVSPWRVSRP